MNQLYHTPLMIAAFLSILSGVRYFQYRTPMARWGGLFLFSLAGELYSYAYQMNEAAPAGQGFWFTLQLICFFLLVVFWFLFVAEIAGLINTRNIWAIVTPLSVLALGLAAMLAGWAASRMTSTSNSGIPASFFQLPAILGVWGLFYTFLCYALEIFTVLILIRLCIKARAESRRLLIPMALGTFLLGLLTVLEQFGDIPFQSIHLTQVGLAVVSFVFFGITIVWRFGGILPISRESVFEGIQDGMLLLDYFDTVVDLNEPAQRIIRLPRKGIVNKKLSIVWPLVARLIAENPGKTFIEKEYDLTINGTEYNFDICISQFTGLNEAPTGRLVVIRNVTTRERMEKTLNDRAQKLQKSNAFLEALAEVTLNLHITTDPSKIAAIIGGELKKLGLTCFIAQADPETSELIVQYVSVAEDVTIRIEKSLGVRLNGFHLDRSQFPGLYQVIETNEVKFRNLSSGEVIYRPGKIPAILMEQILHLIGIEPETKALALPFVTSTRTFGILCIWGGNLEETDIVPFQVFASQVANVMERAMLYETEIQRSSELARSNAMIIALSNVAAQLDTTSDLAQVFNTLGNELKKIQINCMVGTLDDDKQVMKIEYLSISPEVIAWAEKMGSFWPKEITIPRRLWPTDKAITERVSYWDPDPIGNVSRMFPFFPRQIFVKTFEMAGMSLEDQVCYLPMIIEEDVIGILAVWGPKLHRADIPGLSVFANQVATAIRNTRSFDQAQQEIIERTQAEMRTREALREREVLLKEIHHRVKNNLQVISSLLNLQAAQITDRHMIDILHESQNRVRSMALIHEKLYQSNNLARIDFADYLNNLVSSLAQTYQVNPYRVAINVQCEKIELNIDTAIPCGLIVNELVSNSLKYGFPGEKSGVIEVSCKHTQGKRYHLTIQDNGVGLPDGLDVKRSNSLGLKLVSNLTRQIDGELTASGRQGACFDILFADV